MRAPIRTEIVHVRSHACAVGLELRGCVFEGNWFDLQGVDCEIRNNTFAVRQLTMLPSAEDAPRAVALAAGLAIELRKNEDDGRLNDTVAEKPLTLAAAMKTLLSTCISF